jgi:iron complex outermembrane receptor protein
MANVIPFLAHATSLSDEEQHAARIKQLQSLSLEELMEIPIVSVATGLKQNISDAPAVTTVITDKDIQALGATNLSEVLETVPGFQVSHHTNGYMPKYTVRGIYAGQYSPEIAFLVNGTSISTVYLGGFPFYANDGSLQNVKRIEIIRGPGSAVYGADAFAGVVNIITKTAKDIDGVEVGARTGSFKTNSVWFQQGEKIGKNEIALSVELKDTDGDKSIIQEDMATQMDRLFQQSKNSYAPDSVKRGKQNVDARLDVSNENWQWRSAVQMGRKVEMGAGLGTAIDPIGTMKGNVLSSDLNYHNTFAKDWEFKAQASVYYYDMETENFLHALPANFYGKDTPATLAKIGVKEIQDRLNLDVFYNGFNNHSLRLGVGAYYGDLYRVKNIDNQFPNLFNLVDKSNTPNDFLKTAIRKNAYFFAQDVYSMAQDWELTSGLRYDHYSDFGSTVNPRLALVWKTRPDLTTKLLYGRAFRAPSFLELYTRNNLLELGNPDLKPEIIQTYEFVINYQPTSSWRLGLNLFAFDLKKGIAYLPAGQTLMIQNLMTQNAGEQTGKGFEIESRYQVNKQLVLSGHYAFTKTTEKNPLATLGNTPHPEHSAYLRADWQFQKDWFLNLQTNYTGKRNRAFTDPRPAMPSYAIFDLNARYQPKHNFSVSAGVRNLFDKAISDPSPPPNNLGIIAYPYDLPLEGRNYFVEMRYKFN